MDAQLLLDQVDFFKGVSAENKKALAAICQPQRLKKREMLFLEGDRGSAIYLLAEGNVQLFKTTAEGKEVVIKLVQPGELFAEVVLFEKESYPVSAIAIEKSLVYLIAKRAFNQLLARESFRNDFIGMLMRKQRYLVSQIVNLSSADVEERFFHFLAQQYGKKEQYRVTFSKKDLAAAIGTNPETLSRLLFRLKEEGTAVWEGDKLTLRKSYWQTR